MILKTYQKYLIKEYLSLIFKISFIFLILGFIMGILEEMRFFSDIEIDYFFPIFLVFLNLPSLIYEIFPFIILLSIMFLFLNLGEKGELVWKFSNKSKLEAPCNVPGHYEVGMIAKINEI